MIKLNLMYLSFFIIYENQLLMPLKKTKTKINIKLHQVKNVLLKLISIHNFIKYFIRDYLMLKLSEDMNNMF